MQDIKQNLANAVREARTELGLSQEKLAEGIYDLRLAAGEIAAQAVPGQFVSLYSKDGSRLLPRPISLCGIDKEKGELRLVYRVAGAGTKEFSALTAGDTIDVLGPLGNGFPLLEGKKAFLIGGGIVQSVIGYRDSHMFLKEEFEAYGSVTVATEDGSVGTKGNVLDAIRENDLKADVIYACGPTPMLRALKAYSQEKGILCYLSLEEKMACGIGACLACTCQTKDVDEHSQVHNKRICKDGPVFLAEDIEL